MGEVDCAKAPIITFLLWNSMVIDDDAFADRCDVHGAGGPDAAGDPRAAVEGRTGRRGTGGAVRHEPAGGLQAPEGAGARGAGVALARCTAAAGEIRAGAAGGDKAVAARIPAQPDGA